MKAFKPEEKKLLAVCFAITLLVMIACIATPGVGILSRLQQIRKLMEVVAEKEVQVNDAKSKEKILPQMQEEIALAEAKITEVERRLPNDKRAPELFKELNDLAAKAEQKYLSMEARPVVEKPTYIEIPLQIRLKADYHNLGRYINMIELSRRFAKVDQLDISYDFDDPLKQTVNLTVSTFMFVKQNPPSRATANAATRGS